MAGDGNRMTGEQPPISGAPRGTADLPVDGPVAEPVDEFPLYPGLGAGTTPARAAVEQTDDAVSGKVTGRSANDGPRRLWAAIGIVVVIGVVAASLLSRFGGSSGWMVLVAIVVALVVRAIVLACRRPRGD